MQNTTLIEVLKRAKGDRSDREYARESGVSQTLISRVLKGDYIPGASTIQKLTSKQARPQGGVTYEEMMDAAGHLNLSSLYNSPLNDGFPSSSESPEKQKQIEKARLIEQAFTGILLDKISDNHIIYSTQKDNRYYDLVVTINSDTIEELCYDYRIIQDERVQRSLFFTRVLGSLVVAPPSPSKKISIVTNDRGFFELMANYQGLLSFRGNLSALLINLENGDIEECVLSNYDETSK